MSTWNWQDIAVVLVVGAAAAYLCVRVVAVFVKNKRAGCGGGCSTCPSSTAEQKSPTQSMITIEQFTASAKHVGSKHSQ